MSNNGKFILKTNVSSIMIMILTIARKIIPDQADSLSLALIDIGLRIADG